MNKLVPVALTLCLAGLSSAIDKSKAIDVSEDLKPEESRLRIYDIIQSHEGRKFGDYSADEGRKYGYNEGRRDHGGHEYEDGEAPLKLASGKQYGYLPLPVEDKAPVYYDARPKAKDNIYRENVAAYAAKATPVHVTNKPHYALAKPVSHTYYTVPDSKPHHYALVHPKSHNQHYALISPKAHPQHYTAVEPKSHNQYIVFDDQKSHQKPELILDPKPRGSYILEEPEYVVPDHKVIIKPPVVSHTPHYHHTGKDYSHHIDDHLIEDKGHQSSGHGHHADNSIHGESGHKSHKNYELSGHKEHSSKGGHHDEHDRHHNRGSYERDRGYHYEKAYAYDRIRAHHDIGSDKGSHSDYHSHHGQEGHKEKGDHGSQSYMYYKKNDQHGGHGHHDKANSLYKKGHNSGQGYHNYELNYQSPHHHAYGK